MPRCGCAGEGCSCFIVDSEGIPLPGDGSEGNPFVTPTWEGQAGCGITITPGNNHYANDGHAPLIELNVSNKCDNALKLICNSGDPDTDGAYISQWSIIPPVEVCALGEVDSKHYWLFWDIECDDVGNVISRTPVYIDSSGVLLTDPFITSTLEPCCCGGTIIIDPGTGTGDDCECIFF